MKEGEINPFEMAKKQIDITSRYLSVDPGLLAEATKLRGIYP